MLILILCLFLWLHFSIFCHELGHFICAKLVGMKPYLIKVGRGFNLSRTMFFGAQLELNVLPSCGLTNAYYPPIGWTKFDDLRPRLALYWLGGCLANAILLTSSIMILVYGGVRIFWYISLMELGMIVSALIPGDALLYGVKVSTDGKRLFSLITRKYQRFNPGWVAEYQKILARIECGGQKPQTLFSQDLEAMELMVRADTQLIYRRFEEAITLWTRLLSHKTITNSEKACVLDLLTSIVINHGQTQYLAQADRWSQEAMNLAGHAKTIQGTRGAILIELGMHEEGKQLLLPLTEPQNDLLDIIVSNYYLAKAAHRMGDEAQAQGWMAQAKQAGKQFPEVLKMFASIEQELPESPKTEARRVYLA